MKETWRWYGPGDGVSLRDIRQAGAAGVVTSLYHITPGEVWTPEAIADRLKDVETHPDGSPSGLTWDVVESLPVSEAIKTAASERDTHITNWCESLENLAAAGIEVICYNFMPAVDWTRTDLAHARPNGALALRFDIDVFAAFDIHILARDGAAADYSDDVTEAAQRIVATMTDTDKRSLSATVLASLPGAMESWDLDTFHAQLALYRDIDADRLRDHFRYFFERVVPVAERLGLRICAHPDDPPWPLFGLPRIMSTEADYRWLVNAVPSPANGITFCTGSLGARGDNDLPGMIRRLGRHFHFLHLRNVRRETDTVPGTFFEDDHLDGSTDMIAVIRALLEEEARRRAEGRPDAELPMRPDHGQQLLDDQRRVSAPGYPAIGRLRGLAELRGAARALAAT